MDLHASGGFSIVVENNYIWYTKYCLQTIVLYSFDESEFNRQIKGAKPTPESAERDHVNRDYNWSCSKAHLGKLET